MERDINHLLAAGYGVDEVLAAVLHSVRENYLHKVAREPLIGRRICFQGATAKNRSLVAAFEQRLGRPIRVSRYCHLTGAYGAALALGEKGVEKSAFRGIGLFRERIDVRGEACEICRNHCKLSVAEVGGEKAASGMLCGRDYSDARRLTKNRSGFDPIAAWRKHFHTGPAGKQEGPVVGIPAGLYLAEELPLWRKFFGLLNVAVMTSEGLADAVTIGKRLEGAEFCAPIAAFHAHVASLAGKADWIFAPFYMEAGDRPEVVRRNYCYYTQYAPSLAASMQDVRIGERLLTPIIRNRAGDFERMERLRETLKRITGRDPGRLKVALAWKAASGWFRERISALPAVMEREIAGSNDISVVLLGRPYTILSSAMNKGIPRIIGMHGVKCFTQDMLRPGPEDFSRIRPLLEDVHWEYASRTLLAAEAAGRTPGLYPVIVTSFKCAPDSCVTEPLRRIMDHHGKPYLVLQLDEHDAQTGYETRIEAALRTFKNHHRAPGRRPSGALPSNPTRAPGMRGRTVLLPSWDRCAGLMMAANFRREGIDARLLEEDAALISRAQRHNSGQCIPLNIIAEEAVEYMRRHGTDPEKTAVWIHSSQLGCNIGAFPQVIQSILDARGGGFEKASVYVGQMTASDVSLRAVINQYLVLMLAGWLRRTGCRIRPYEVNAGETDAALEESLMEFVKVFEAGGNVSAAVRKTADRLTAIRRMDGERPKVAVFGDLYARDNDVLSQDLVRLIERNGGEVITTPYTEYMKLISGAYIRKWFREGKYGQAAASRALLSLAKTLERKHIREFRRVLRLERRPVRRMAPGDVLGLYRVTDRHSGESFDNLLKVHRLIEDHPDIALFVQMSPAFCCPSLVTEAMSREIERNTGVPVVTITYDGTLSPKNGPVIPHLHKLQR
jgi:predicted nucleotide-binding protein (sugar kinase/HSP70/actin superfamily)